MNGRFRLMACIRILLVAGVLSLAPGASVRADGPLRAGLIIAYAPDDVQTVCIRLDSDEVTGVELLQRAGLDVVLAGAAGVGDSVCKIGAVGCDYPGEHCFCQCLSTPCAFWSYWYWQDGDWIFSQSGASSRRVTDGAVEAWVWGDGQTPPPAIDLTDEGGPFLAICPALPRLSSPASQDGYPGPDDSEAYPGPDEEEPSEPTPEPEPTADEVLPPTVVPREDTPSPEESAEPEVTPSSTPSEATPGATSTPTATPTLSRTPTVTATATVGPTPSPSATTGPSATPTDDGMAAAIATAVARSRATPPATAGGSGVGSYVAFALLALVLIALIVYAILLRRQHARSSTE